MQNFSILYLRRVSTLVLVMCLLALVQGCLLKTPRQRGIKEASTPPPPSPYSVARDALVQGDYAKAELLAQRLLKTRGLRQEDFANASMIYSRAASLNNHPNAALSSLDAWRVKVPGAESNPFWQEVWSDSIGQLHPREGLSRAEKVLQDSKRSPAMHGLALAYSTVKEWEGEKLGESFDILATFYGSLPDPTSKGQMELALLRELDRADAAAISLVAESVSSENQDSFPYNIILIDQLRRQSQNPATKAEAEDSLKRLSKALHLADPSLVHELKREPIAPPAALVSVTEVHSGPIEGRAVVLVLPMSGRYGAISSKIAAGAAVACQEAQSAGGEASLVLIDADQPDWLGRVKGLPKEVTVIGGPLRLSDYSALKGAGELNSRAVFAFLPRLDEGDEGRLAWRFFSSPADQVRALVGLLQRFGIKNSAVLYPEETYGTNMLSLFDSEASMSGVSVTGKMGYTPDNPGGWLRAVGNLMATNKNPESAASATFRAIFLPDSWKNMNVLVPNIFYYGETRQLLLGTSLWEQELSAKSVVVDPQFYGLAVFPGAWSGAAKSVARSPLQEAFDSQGRGHADFWGALGYDFGRFALQMNVAPGFNSATINKALHGMALSFSMAPLHWDDGGRVRQELFLFTPVEGGFAPLDEAAMKAAYSSAWK